MKHVVSAVAVALSLLVGSVALARDGDGYRSYDRGHSSRHDGHRGHRDHDYRGDRRGYDSRRSYGDRRFYGDRKFFSDRKFDRRFYDRKFDRRFDDRRFDDRRFYGRKFDDRRFYRDRYYYRSFRRGDRLPSVFLSTRFVVNDFSSHRLYRPPRGYRWVRVERDAFLTGVATGVIIAVATDRFF